MLGLRLSVNVSHRPGITRGRPALDTSWYRHSNR